MVHPLYVTTRPIVLSVRRHRRLWDSGRKSVRTPTQGRVRGVPRYRLIILFLSVRVTHFSDGTTLRGIGHWFTILICRSRNIRLPSSTVQVDVTGLPTRPESSMSTKLSCPLLYDLGTYPRCPPKDVRPGRLDPGTRRGWSCRGNPVTSPDAFPSLDTSSKWSSFRGHTRGQEVLREPGRRRVCCPSSMQRSEEVWARSTTVDVLSE